MLHDIEDAKPFTLQCYPTQGHDFGPLYVFNHTITLVHTSKSCLHLNIILKDLVIAFFLKDPYDTLKRHHKIPFACVMILRLCHTFWHGYS